MLYYSYPDLAYTIANKNELSAGMVCPQWMDPKVIGKFKLANPGSGWQQSQCVNTHCTTWTYESTWQGLIFKKFANTAWPYVSARTNSFICHAVFAKPTLLERQDLPNHIVPSSNPMIGLIPRGCVRTYVAIVGTCTPCLSLSLSVCVSFLCGCKTENVKPLTPIQTQHATTRPRRHVEQPGTPWVSIPQRNTPLVTLLP